MEKPLVSIVMSTYNDERSLEKSIESILNQTLDNFEFIIINDGSTDNSNLIIQKYADLDSRIIYIDQHNKGLTRSLNIGIKTARGQYIARQDADDISLPNRLSQQIHWLENYNYDFCCSRAILNKTKRTTPKITFYFSHTLIALYKNPFIHGTFVIKKFLLDKIGGYDEHFTYAQDYKLIIDLINISARIKKIPSPLYILGEQKNRISIAHLNEQNIYSKEIQKIYYNNIINRFRNNGK
jgi:glycosyltransferase involved in cell wall biosynthesis